ncbi:orotidine-5'-phosphate decarboxylase [Diaminobutyricibacter tongyongensis]|uniref:Orotidine-5'-phosphate decarboxylase n=1 Tax=Leifsonia tongyongensis TaxID=1268043 RepID=A0A6L9XXX3_9MICO|nr:orotidine-5'-phosphate decarboxylase [Diaminobutyricibacter tongyongensis]NEN06292.1 orotidine-5'-phosphate decarboxylase [Diaminobutyricibacter tongyongensis]
MASVFAEFGRLCVGIDPHPHLLREWGLEESGGGARDFGLRVVDAAAGRAGIVKPQVAFFERFGAAGYAALEDVLASARAAGLLVIADAKRGDIGTTVEAYAQAWLTPGSPLEADAMTIAAFQGVGSIAEPMALAEASGKGLFVLAATSNPEAELIQRAVLPVENGSARTVSRAIIEDVKAFNEAQSAHPFGSIGVVIGATLDLSRFGIDTGSPAGFNPPPVLAPGFGHQGAALSAARSIFGSYAPATIVSESRAILAAGPERIAEVVGVRAEQVRAELGAEIG